MLDGKYRVGAQMGYNYVSSNRGNRHARVQVKKQFKELKEHLSLP